MCTIQADKSLRFEFPGYTAAVDNEARRNAWPHETQSYLFYYVDRQACPPQMRTPPLFNYYAVRKTRAARKIQGIHDLILSPDLQDVNLKQVVQVNRQVQEAVIHTNTDEGETDES